MPVMGVSTIKEGFYLGLGVALALAVWTAIQMLLARAVHKGG